MSLLQKPKTQGMEGQSNGKWNSCKKWEIIRNVSIALVCYLMDHVSPPVSPKMSTEWIRGENFELRREREGYSSVPKNVPTIWFIFSQNSTYLSC